MRLTRRGVAVLVLAVVLLGAGILVGHPMVRALGGICVGAVLVGRGAGGATAEGGGVA